jgi:hypothetical protein
VEETVQGDGDFVNVEAVEEGFGATNVRECVEGIVLADKQGVVD